MPLENQTVNEGQTFSYQLPVNAFIDLDGDPLTYSATLADGSALPSWLVFDGATESFSGTPTDNDAGELSIKVLASDGMLSAEQVFTVNVEDYIYPWWDAWNNIVFDNVSVLEGEILSLQLSDLEHPDTVVLNYSAVLADGSALPDWLAFDANTLTFSGTPSFDDATVLAVKVMVSDGESSAEQVFTIDVIDVINENSPPEALIPLDNQNAAEGQLFSYQLPTDAFVDVDNDVLTYSATLADGSALPDWLTFDGATQTFSGTPPSGIWQVQVTASDGLLSANQTFGIWVEETQVPPVWVGEGLNFSMEEDSGSLNIDVLSHIYDANGDVLTVSNVSMDASQGTATLNQDQSITFTPAENLNGTVSVSYDVSDGVSTLTVTESIIVNAVNDIPVVSNALGEMSEDDVNVIGGVASDDV